MYTWYNVGQTGNTERDAADESTHYRWLWFCGNKSGPLPFGTQLHCEDT